MTDLTKKVKGAEKRAVSQPAPVVTEAGRQARGAPVDRRCLGHADLVLNAAGAYVCSQCGLTPEHFVDASTARGAPRASAAFATAEAKGKQPEADNEAAAVVADRERARALGHALQDIPIRQHVAERFTATGRRRSEPALQNIPVRTETGRRLRAAFVAAGWPDNGSGATPTVLSALAEQREACRVVHAPTQAIDALEAIWALLPDDAADLTERDCKIISIIQEALL